MRSFLALLVFIVLQILFIPLGIIGVILVGYRQLIVSKNLGVSQTAIEIINGRWTMHVFGLRDDLGRNVLYGSQTGKGTWMVVAEIKV